MKLLFVDETDKQENAGERLFFCICGLIVDEQHVIAASNDLEAIKAKYGISNLKDCRKKAWDENARIAITKEISAILQEHGVKVIGIVLGSYSMSYKLPKPDLYMGAISFLAERFALGLLKDKTVGVVVFDSVDEKSERVLRKKFYEYIQQEVITMAWDTKPKGAMKDLLLPTLLFAEDDQSVLIQATDLVATSLNSALVNTTKNGQFEVDDLPNGNKFLKIYWPLFERSPAGKVKGWGIKHWD